MPQLGDMLLRQNNAENYLQSQQASEDLEVLISLGLSPSEAKIFLNLSNLESCAAGTIAKKTGIARESVYQIIQKLLEKGLVEVIIAVPKKFKTVPMQDALRILLRRKEDENRELFLKAMKTIEKHRNKKVLQPVAVEFQTSLVPSTEVPDTRIGQEYRNVQKSVDLTFPVGKFLQWSQHYAEMCLKEVTEKNVKMRIITQQSLLRMLATQPKLFNRRFKSQLKKLDFRYVQKPFSVEMMIFDRKTLFISTTSENNINKMIWLRTNNPLILEMAIGYFEAMWKEAESAGTKFAELKRNK
jgi:DNA-binding MarR family transcriptional regulator